MTSSAGREREPAKNKRAARNESPEEQAARMQRIRRRALGELEREERERKPGGAGVD